QKIGERAFYDCTSIASVTFGNSLKWFIGGVLSGRVVLGSRDTASVTFEADTEYRIDIDGSGHGFHVESIDRTSTTPRATICPFCPNEDGDPEYGLSVTVDIHYEIGPQSIVEAIRFDSFDDGFAIDVTLNANNKD
ncbi:leucine-rich repeat domain-containing protein, partial [bacterium]|nr:leucine-rich repeat domain-containing protein [bacterium]